jgi:type VI secretion system protein ImpA
MTDRDDQTPEIDAAGAAQEAPADAAPAATQGGAADGAGATDASGPVSPFAALDLADLVAPVSADEPCGPDLDLEGDLDFMNYLARAEGLLPASYFSFDRNALDLPAEIAAGMALAQRTRNVQLLALLAKFSILNRDLKGYARRIAAIAELLETRWDEVHPRPFEGDHSLRMGAAQSLDDPAPSVLPLQHAPLFRFGRLGTVSFRAHLVASGELTPRDGEEHPDAGSIDKALGEVEIEQLVESRDLVGAIRIALERIRAVAVDRAGYEVAPKFERLGPLADKIFEWLDERIVQRDPSQAQNGAAAQEEPGGGAAAAHAPPGEIATVRHVAAALAALDSYFARTEPSNPALLLVRQAQQLVGKSFLDAMRVLAPSFVDQAAVQIGRSDSFSLPLDRLSEFAMVDESALHEGPEPEPMAVTTRPEAIGLMAAVIGFYARAEPSSPVPFLLERARALAGRDFLAILKDILPADTLRNPNG